MSDPNYFSQCSWENQWECNWKHYFFVTWRSKKKEGLGMEILQLKWAHRKMDELPDLGCLIWWQASKMFLGYFCSLQSASFIFMSHLYSVKKVVHFIYLFLFHLEVYVCIYMCSVVQWCEKYSCKGVFCMYLYVCVLSEFVLVPQGVVCCCSSPAAIETL